MSRLYYTAPSEESFNDMKNCCMSVWQEMDNTYGYVDEKVARIADISNVQDNFMYMFGMFDADNQKHVVDILLTDTRKDLKDRLIDGGNDEFYCSLIGL